MSGDDDVRAAAVTRIAIGVEYDGACFNGWQLQDGVATVQEALERALSRVADEPVRVIGAGRTDTGVHATAQVAHFDTRSVRSPYNWVRGANTMLPQGVVLLWAREAVEGFHARFSAVRRGYRYVVLNRPLRPTYLRRRVTWEYRPLELGRMREAARMLVGRHDFSAFRSSHCQARTPVRRIENLEVSNEGAWFWIDVQADAFLHHMVRNIAGVLLAIGAGERAPEWAGTVLESRDRRRGGVTAPADGLYLTGVGYPSRFSIPEPASACRFW